MTILRKRLSCGACGGEGVQYTSRYGGNDPDVYAVGTCSACNGTGDQQCEDCGDSDAVVEYTDPHNRLNQFLLCKKCFDAWTAEDADGGDTP